MPHVANVMAIRPRKTWMTRLYLVTRSNTGQRPERMCEFYRTNGIEGLVDDAHPPDAVTAAGYTTTDPHSKELSCGICCFSPVCSYRKVSRATCRSCPRPRRSSPGCSK